MTLPDVMCWKRFKLSVNPKVIDTPPVTAVAKDGIQLIAKARVTVRANIRQLVGGAGEENVLARVGEGVVSSIGSANSHKAVLENPDSISKVVLEKGLIREQLLKFCLLILPISILEKYWCGSSMDQANADKNIAQAKAEERRAMAVALEQEMKAKAEEARANVIQAEAEVQKPWPKHSAQEIWELWITINSKILNRIPVCGIQFQKLLRRSQKAVQNRMIRISFFNKY